MSEESFVSSNPASTGTETLFRSETQVGKKVENVKNKTRNINEVCLNQKKS